MGSWRVGVLVVSDRVSKGEAADKSGPACVKTILSGLEGSKVTNVHNVPDEIPQIKEVLLRWADDLKLPLILTTGGTGFAPRDVTPEATREIIEKEAPGLSTAMMVKSLEITPMAALSRGVCGIRGSSLIVNLPGSPKGCQENLEVITPVLKHALKLLTDDTKTDDTHAKMQGDASKSEK